MQQEKVEPEQEAKLAIYRVGAFFAEVSIGKLDDLCCYFLAQAEQVLHDLTGRKMAGIGKAGIAFGSIGAKVRIVAFQYLFDTRDKSVLISGQVYDIFKNAPFAGKWLAADLFIGEPIDDLQQRLVLILKPG